MFKWMELAQEAVALLREIRDDLRALRADRELL